MTFPTFPMTFPMDFHGIPTTTRYQQGHGSAEAPGYVGPPPPRPRRRLRRQKAPVCEDGVEMGDIYHYVMFLLSDNGIYDFIILITTIKILIMTYIYILCELLLLMG